MRTNELVITIHSERSDGMNNADFTRLARTGAVCTYMQHRRRRERRIKLAAAVIGTLTLVALFAWALPG